MRRLLTLHLNSLPRQKGKERAEIKDIIKKLRNNTEDNIERSPAWTRVIESLDNIPDNN